MDTRTFVAGNEPPMKEAGLRMIETDGREIPAGSHTWDYSLTYIAIPEGVERIGREAFQGCYNLRHVALPSSVTEICEGAFEDCARLRDVTMSDNLRIIGDHAFRGCVGFNPGSLPSALESIGKGAFGGCVSITAFDCLLNDVYRAGWNGCLVDRRDDTLVAVPAGYPSDTIEINNRNVMDEAMWGCRWIRTVKLGKKVECIGPGAFRGLERLWNIPVSPGNGAYRGGDCLLSGSGDILIKVPSRFHTDFTIPRTVREVHAEAFADTNIRNLVIPASVRVMPEDMRFRYMVTFIDTEEGFAPERCPFIFKDEAGETITAPGGMHFVRKEDGVYRRTGVCKSAGDADNRTEMMPSFHPVLSEAEGLDALTGLDEEVGILRERIVIPSRFPGIHAGFDLGPRTSVLLYGPRGTGKTELARGVAAELGYNLYVPDPFELRAKYSLNTLRRISTMFRIARSDEKGAVLLLDRFEVIASVREVGRDSQDLVIRWLLAEMRDLAGGRLVVIAVTDRPWMVDRELLGDGCFGTSLLVDLPDREDRVGIIEDELSRSPCDEDVDIGALADLTEGRTRSEVRRMVRRARTRRAQLLCGEAPTVGAVTMDDLTGSIGSMGPTIPEMAVEWCRRHAAEHGSCTDEGPGPL
ncbi:MAG: leucine-rich repeat protein [archaeon]|nr:leucine-rich repeat protein [archaeon]